MMRPSIRTTGDAARRTNAAPQTAREHRHTIRGTNNGVPALASFWRASVCAVARHLARWPIGCIPLSCHTLHGGVCAAFRRAAGCIYFLGQWQGRKHRTEGFLGSERTSAVCDASYRSAWPWWPSRDWPRAAGWCSGPRILRRGGGKVPTRPRLTRSPDAPRAMGRLKPVGEVIDIGAIMGDRLARLLRGPR